jgi:hypothetical protein
MRTLGEGTAINDQTARSLVQLLINASHRKPRRPIGPTSLREVR